MNWPILLAPSDPPIIRLPIPSGLYRWTDAAPADLVADVRQYFDDRREDG